MPETGVEGRKINPCRHGIPTVNNHRSATVKGLNGFWITDAEGMGILVPGISMDRAQTDRRQGCIEMSDKFKVQINQVFVAQIARKRTVEGLAIAGARSGVTAAKKK